MVGDGERKRLHVRVRLHLHLLLPQTVHLHLYSGESNASTMSGGMGARWSSTNFVTIYSTRATHWTVVMARQEIG